MNKLLIIAASLLGLLSSSASIIFYSGSQLPVPKGPYGVGQNSYHWVDSSRKELNAQDPELPYRELMVYIYYPTSLKLRRTGPTEKNEAAALVAYDADASKSAMEYLAMCSHMPEWFFSSVKSIKTHAQHSAPLAKSSTPFPVIIFSHGGGPIVQPFSTPFMFMHPEKSFIRDKNHPFYIFKGKPVKEKTSESWYEKLAKIPNATMNIVTIKEVGHAIFTDVAFQLNMTVFGRFISRHACFHLEVPAEKSVDILTNNVMPQIINFFDEHLRIKEAIKAK